MTADAFRDVDLERLVIGHIMLWPEDVRAYWEAGLGVEDFSDGDLRIIMSAIAALHEDGVAPDERTVRNAVLDRVPPPFLSALVDGVPRQRRENIRQHVDRLAMFRRCRALERGEHTLVDQLRQRPELINNGLLGHRIEQLTALQTEAAADSDELLVDDVRLLELPPPRYLVDGRLVAGSLAAIVGPPGAGKTFCAIDLGLCIATGRPWLGAGVHEGAVVYVAAEGVPGLQSRVRAWKLAHNVPLDQPSGFRLYPRALNLLEPAAVATFLRASRRLCPALVIVDTLARCMAGGDENSALDMGRVIHTADQVRVAIGATVLFLHHTTKAGGSERGSSALRGALDTLLALNPTDDLLTLSVEKQKDAPPFSPITLRLDLVGDSCVIRPAHQVANDADRLSDWQLRCLRVLKTSFPRTTGATSPEWLDAIPEINRRTFYHARTVLHDRGYIEFKGPRNLATSKPELLDGCEPVQGSARLSAMSSDNDGATKNQGDFEL